MTLYANIEWRMFRRSLVRNLIRDTISGYDFSIHVFTEINVNSMSTVVNNIVNAFVCRSIKGSINGNIGQYAPRSKSHRIAILKELQREFT